MATLEMILQLAGPLFTSLVGLVTKAIAASSTNDQATLDALHAQAIAAADALKPAGAQGV